MIPLTKPDWNSSQSYMWTWMDRMSVKKHWGNKWLTKTKRSEKECDQLLRDWLPGRAATCDWGHAHTNTQLAWEYTHRSLPHLAKIEWHVDPTPAAIWSIAWSRHRVCSCQLAPCVRGKSLELPSSDLAYCSGLRQIKRHFREGGKAPDCVQPGWELTL